MPAVLLVEDEWLIREDAAETLVRAGYTVTLAKDSRDALAHIREAGAFDILVTDIRMPGSIDGAALAHIVANCWRSTAIVVASGEALPSDLPAKAVFVSKPYDERQLLAAVEEARCLNDAELARARIPLLTPSPAAAVLR